MSIQEISGSAANISGIHGINYQMKTRQIDIRMMQKNRLVYERDIWKNTEEAAVKMIEDKDITVTKVSDEEKQNLREKLQPIYDKYCSKLY